MISALNIKTLKKKNLKNIFFNEKLSKFSWFNLGGPAQVVFRPKNLIELSTFLKELKNEKINHLDDDYKIISLYDIMGTLHQ